LAYWNGSTSPGNSGATDWGWLILPYLKHGSAGTYNSQDPTGIWALYKDKDTLSGNRPDLAWYDSEKVQTYAVHPQLFRFEPGPVSPTTLAMVGAPKSGPDDDGKRPFKLGQVRRSAEILMLMDSSQFYNNGLGDNTWASFTTLWAMQAISTNYCQNWATLAEAQQQFPNGPDAGLNKDYKNDGDMTYDTGPNGATGNNMRFRHMKNTVANALFLDGHVGTFHWKRPGFGGSDLQFKNFILDDLRKQDMKFAGS
jgi:prepilin-type processing-associated H-X9-DG protein